MIPNIEEIKGDIAELVRQEGSESEENISLFLANPYIADPMKLRFWAAEAMRKREKEPLEKKIKELEGQIQNAGKGVLKKIEKAAQESKTLTAKTGADSEEEPTGLTEDQIPNLTDEELKQHKKRLMRKFA